jgi:ribosomal protein S18 acetylase RimI-like enzyme
MAVLGKLSIRTASVRDLPELNAHPAIKGLLSCEHQELIEDPGTQLWVAVVEDTICGHVNARWTGFRTPQFRKTYPDSVVLNGLAVWPEERRNAGIGSALTQALEAAATARGFRRVGLGIFADNHNARRFYERLGYVSWGREPIADVHGNTDPGVIAMTKELT